MANDQKQQESPKVCFVTIGATARFDSLIAAALSPSFLQTLKTAGYTDLVLQHGTEGGRIYKDFLAANPVGSEGRYGLKISGFDFRSRGLKEEMCATRGEGLIICHAGTGSILDALRISATIVVVPNTDLLENHQEQLAKELSRLGYVVHGRVDALPEVIPKSDILRAKNKAWPEKDKNHDPSGRGLAGVMDDEMGFYD